MNSEFGIRNSECRPPAQMMVAGCWMQDAGCRMLGFEAWGSRLEGIRAARPPTRRLEPTDSSTPPSAPLGMTPSWRFRHSIAPVATWICHPDRASEVSEYVIPTERAKSRNMSFRPGERSLGICHSDRASEVSEYVIPTERVMRASGGIYVARGVIPKVDYET